MTMHKKHHYRELLSIGFPIIIGQLGTIILGFADTLMIGHHSTPELAAAGLVNNIFGLVFVSYMGFTYGLTPIIGRLYGEERTDVIGQKVRNSFLANMLTGGIFTLALILLYLNLAHIGQPEELLELIRPYFLVNLASVLFMGIFYTMKQFHRRTHFDKVVCVSASVAVRLQRIMQRDHISQEKAQQWIDAVMPQEELIARSDYEIVNDGVRDVEAQVVHLLNLLNPSDN
jgi:Na+-driven multidrug efflux pump